MKSLSALLKEAREEAGLTQQDLLARARTAHGRGLSLRVLSKLESGGTCKASTLEIILNAIPHLDRGRRDELVTAWNLRSNRQFAQMMDVRPAGSRTSTTSKRSRMLALVETLPKDKQDLIAELIQDPDGMKVLDWALDSYMKLKKATKQHPR